ncbi:hypothetical protein MHY85_05100 [Cellulomonas sp. ACRRI]|uniref:hypothetical protein n=1 Tax=Cellulomonas sp. ACRRI TaxID=2918188 RepID=UPI001EF3533A|nr:hypothetical protein [Cellulomonas sp. ACRRI]MCG7285352.1 hypothetical protein [Cellulomonas sp. ACRRI]
MEMRKADALTYLRPGVVPIGGSAVVGTSGWQYQVQPVGLVGQRIEGDGYHVFGNDGPVTVGTSGVGGTVPAAPGSGLSRIDVVWARQTSAGENADTVSEPVFGVTVGTPASVPVAPTIPAGAVELARNTMTSAATSTASAGNSIAQTSALTGVRGTPIAVRTDQERATLASQVYVATGAPLLVWNIPARRFEFTYDRTQYFRLPGTTPWTTYTPVWSTASGSQPSVGNGSITGMYKMVDDLVVFTIRMQIGSSGAAGGTGAWRWSLPGTVAGLEVAVNGWLFTDGTGRSVAARAVPGAAFVQDAITGTGASLGSGFVLAANAVLTISGSYYQVV